MKLKMIQAPNMQKAMLRIQKEIGPDAVIYRTKECIGGVEILAGIPTVQAAEPTLLPIEEIVESKNTMDSYVSQQMGHFNQVLENLTKKVGQLCEVEQFNVPKDKVDKKFEEHFKKMGFSDEVINKVFSSFIKKQRINNAIHHKVMDEILSDVKLLQEEIINKNNTIALVGPTGVGKTTTIIKMAIRYLERHDTNEILMITTDMEDLTTKNKLGHFCKQFEIDYQHAQSAEELRQILAMNTHKKLILIDTHGVSQNDKEGIQYLQSFFQKLIMPVSVYVVLACYLQEKVMQDTASTFSFNNLSGCILTKIDESTNLSIALGVSMINKLPIAYLCNGQDIDTNISVPTRKKINDSLPIIFENDGDEVDSIKPSKISHLLKQLSFGIYGC